MWGGVRAYEDEKEKDRTLLNSITDSLWNGVSEVWPGKVKCRSKAAGSRSGRP